MEEHPLFSVLIANYNDGKYLQEAIESIFAQTYDNWEIVIVDDGSTDNSKDIYDKYKEDRRFHIFFNERNMGCGYTKRKCVELSTGEICGFLDADDCITPEAINIMVEAHLQHPQCSLVYSQYNIADSNLNITGKSIYSRAIPPSESLLMHPWAISQFVTFKRSKYLETAGINPNYKAAEDIDIYLKLEETGEPLFIEKLLYTYRCNTGNNISQGERLSRTAFYYEILAKYEACKRRGIPVETNLFPIIDNFSDSIFNNGVSEGESRIRNTRSYKLGHKIISPFKNK